MLTCVSASGTYQDLAGNVGTSDLNATVPVSVLSTDTTLSSGTTTSSTTPLSRRGMAGVIIGVIIGAFFLVLLCFLVSHVGSVQGKLGVA